MSNTTTVSFPTDNSGKIERAVELKNEGNEFFKVGNFKKAKTKYYTALAFTKGLPGRTNGDGMGKMASKEVYKEDELVSPEQEAFIIEFEATTKTNIATCFLKLNDAANAIECTREALLLKPNAWKAQLRQAEASIMLHYPERAVSILDAATKNAPIDDVTAHTAIEKMKERANKIIKQEESKQRKAFSNIFEKARATAEEDPTSH